MFETSIIDREITELVDLKLIPGKHYIGHITGGGEIQYWDGLAYVAYLDSGTGFQFFSPASGQVRVTAPATFSLHTAS